MAFNWQIFKTRTITAAIFAIIMLAGLLINHWTFFILFSVIHFGCWLEYQKLVGLIDKEYQKISSFHKYGVMIAGWCIMLYFTNDSYNIFGFTLHELGWWTGLTFLFVLPIIELLFAPNIQLKNIGYSAFGLVYISLSWGLMMDLRQNFFVNDDPHDELPKWLSLIIPLTISFSLWINDTMAYIVGSIIGKTVLSRISPKKTVEGTIGGIILSVIVVALLITKGSSLSTSPGRLPHMWWVIIPAITAIVGTFGDLLESKLKRIAKVKDSGNLMPGHGGFLDRFDSMLLAIPAVWLYVYFFIR